MFKPNFDEKITCNPNPPQTKTHTTPRQYPSTHSSPLDSGWILPNNDIDTTDLPYCLEVTSISNIFGIPARL